MNEVHVIAYFGDDPTRTYQLVQWLDVLEILHDRHPVGIVVRDPASALVLAARTTLPILTAPSFPELTALYDELDAKVVLYCNNSMLNFQSLLDGRSLHVHINHGESDKQSMASNNAKAYDRVFVAGEAAVQRHAAGLLEFDTSPAGAHRATAAGPAPGPAAGADHATYGPLRADVGGRRGVQRLHLRGHDRRRHRARDPGRARRTPGLQAAPQGDHQPDAGGARGAPRDPGAGGRGGRARARRRPRADPAGDILAVMPDCDAMVTDVSSVGLDWLYLCTEQPIFLTDRHHDAERLRQEVPVSRCADVIDESHRADLTALLTARLEHDEHHLARVAMRHHYFDDLQVGDSTNRFLEAVSELVASATGCSAAAPRRGRSDHGLIGAIAPRQRLSRVVVLDVQDVADVATEH